MLKAAKIILVTHAGGLLLFIFSRLEINDLISKGYTFRLLFIISYVIAYFIASIFVLYDKRWAWIVSSILLALMWLRYFAKLAINMHELFFGQLYQDSPMTMVVLIIELIPTFFIPSVIFFLMFLRRHEIKASLSS